MTVRHDQDMMLQCWGWAAGDENFNNSSKLPIGPVKALGLDNDDSFTAEDEVIEDRGDAKSNISSVFNHPVLYIKAVVIVIFVITIIIAILLVQTP